MIERDKLIKEISYLLSIVKSSVKILNHCNLYDVNIHAEDFYLRLLNLVYDYNLVNLNNLSKNVTAIDLGDEDERVTVQVTSENSNTKIQETIDGVISKEYYKQYNRLIILLILDKKKYRTVFDTKDKFRFNPVTDIIEIDDLVKEIKAKDISLIRRIRDFLNEELGVNPTKRFLELIKKEEYKFDKLYIPRTVTFENTKHEDTIYKYEKSDSTLKSILLDDRINVDDKGIALVLLSDAAKGKSIELEYLASEICKMDNKFPLLIKLDSYTAGTMEELIPNIYHINSNNIYIIFDDFDEVNINKQKDLAKMIIEFKNKYSRINIIIACRTNFYRDNLKSFNKVILNDLNQLDIENYVKENCNSPIDFLSRVSNLRINNLLSSPFYLTKLVSLYNQKQGLPVKHEIMGYIVQSSFSHDINTYVNTKSLVDYEIIINEKLIKIASIMQLSGKTSLTNQEYQRIIKRVDERELLKYSGVFKLSLDNWKFTHSNFKEYFTALWLKEIGTKEVLEITVDKNRKLKMNWLNTVTHYISLADDIKYINSILKNNIEEVTMLEKDVLHEERRFQIFKKIVKYYSDKNQWISRAKVIVRHIVSFGESLYSLEFLLHEVDKKKHFRALYNAIYLLGEFSYLFGMDNKVAGAFLDVCGDENVRVHEKNTAIDSMKKLKLYSKSTVDELVNMFQRTQYSEIREAMLQYLMEYDNKDYLVKMIIYSADCIVKGKDETEDGAMTTESYYLEKAVELIESKNHVKELFMAFFSNKSLLEADHRQFAVRVIDKAIDLFNNTEEDKEIFDLVFNNLLDRDEDIFQYCRYFRKLFDETNTNMVVYEKLLHIIESKDDYEWNELYLFENIMTEETVSDFSTKFINGELKNLKFCDRVFIRYSSKYSSIEGLTKKYVEMFQKELPVPEVIDSNEEYKRGNQAYFDALFSKESFQNLIVDLISIANNPNLAYKELFDIEYSSLSKREDLRDVQHDLFHYQGESEKAVYTFISEIDWNHFSIVKIYNMLKKDEKNEIEVSEEQLRYIKQFYDEKINSINFSEVYKESGNGHTIAIYALITIFLMLRFGFDCSEKILLDMITIDNYILKLQFDNDDKCFGDIEDKINKEALKEKVVSNIKTLNLGWQVSRNHVRFCLENEMNEAIDFAKNFMVENLENNYCKYTMIEYLIHNEQHSFLVSDEVVLNNSDEIIINILKQLYQKGVCLNEILKLSIKKYKKDNNALLYLKYIILLKPNYGLKIYYKKANKEKKPIGDRYDDSCTEAIGKNTNRSKAIVHLLRLAKLTTSKGFKDDTFNSIYSNTLDGMFNKIHNSKHKGTIIWLLKFYMFFNLRNKEFISLCNNAINRVKINDIKPVMVYNIEEALRTYKNMSKTNKKFKDQTNKVTISKKAKKIIASITLIIGLISSIITIMIFLKSCK